MASNILPQALVAIPSNYSIQCPPLKNHLGFPLDTNRRLSLSNFKGSNSMLISRASSNLLSSNFSSFFSIPAKKTFLVRSEPESAEPSETDTVEVDIEAPIVEDGDENSEPEAEIVAEAEAEAEVRPPRQPRVKMGDIMGLLNKRAVEASEEMRPVPDIRVGDVVQIKLEVPENRRRLSVYKGIVISRQNAGIHTTFRTRRIIAGVGVEIVFPLYSPNIKEIKVVDHRKVRKAKLFYLRDKLPRLSSFK